MTWVLRRRQWTQRAMVGLCAAFAVGVSGVLIFVLGYLAYQGGASLNWAFFTQLPAPPGEPGGGMANAIVGSGKLLVLALGLGVPAGVGAGLFLAEYSRRWSGFVVRFSADLLNGVPSIIIGLFAYTAVVVPLGRFSALAGGFALAVMTIPIIARTTEQFVRAVPEGLREGAMALGAGRWQSLRQVIVPAAAGGIVTGILLALARVAGETAPLLFTAFGNRYWSRGWLQPIASLPVMIYTYAIGPYRDWHRQAWAAALVLLLLVLGVNIAARQIVRSWGKKQVRP